MYKKQHSYLKVFFTAFIVFALITVPVVIYTKGYMIYYGDFNSQQLPFLHHMTQSVKNGNMAWDWGTDLGSDFITAYSYYLLGSPFFWIMALLPSNLTLFSIPWLLALKYATAALTSYAYIRRFVKLDSSAVIGAFLYAFSGFQSYNIFFNQFHDVTAFFPLMLIAMEEHITQNKRGFFALTVALMAIINYFFFAGQVVFLIIYFILRSRCPDFKVTPGKFFTLALEAVIGTGISAVLLLPSALSVFGNFRVSEHMYGTDLISYSDRTRIWRIIQSFFMIPDVPARPNLFSSGTSKWASIAGYLPMFSMIGVISFLKFRPDNWKSKLIKICIVCAFVPVLNSAFYMFNASYYARWYYMPILIMALVTAQVFERPDIHPRSGMRACVVVFTAMLIILCLPSKKDDDVKWFSFGADKIFFFISLAVTLVFFIIAAVIFNRKKNREPYIRSGVVFTVAAAFACTATIFYYGISIGPYPEKYLANTVNDTSAQILSEDKDFFRTDISENCDNYAMFWGYPSMRSFHSTVSPSVMEFYSSVDITRDVASRADMSYYSLRGLFSVKYYFSQKDNNKEIAEPELPGFVKISDGDNFAVYENEYFIPMGFAYNSYISNSQFKSLTGKYRANILMNSILLNDNQIEKYCGILKHTKNINASLLNDEKYLDDCKELQKSACYDFQKYSGGFSAKIQTEKECLVFFSVPFDKGFSAEVNGKPAEIEKVNNGFMAVAVPEGDSTIVFTYKTYGLKTGIQISVISAAVLFVYAAACLIYKRYVKISAAELSKASGQIQPDDETVRLKLDSESPIDITVE